MPTITSRIKDYNVTQYLRCALDPTSGSNNFIAGAQDNGSVWSSSPGIASGSTMYDGDGTFCAIDQNNPNIIIVRAAFGPFARSTVGGGSLFNFAPFMFGTALQVFMTPTDYDYIGNVLYYSKNISGDVMFVNNMDGTMTSGQFSMSPSLLWPGLIKASPYTPNTVFISGGLGSGAPPILRIVNANTATPTITVIPSPPVPSSSQPSSIDFGINELQMLITYSNYGVVSVWETLDGGVTWNSVEGDLPNMPIWSCLYNPYDRKEVILATELGVWSCDDITSASPNWFAINTGLANVKVTQLKTRASDNLVIASTYGRGLFSSNLFLHPIPNFTFSGGSPCFNAGNPISFTDLSTLTPTSWLWDFGDGSTSTLQNPTYTYPVSGIYTVTLTATNANGCGTTTQQIIIDPPSTSTFPPDLYITDLEFLPLSGQII